MAEGVLELTGIHKRFGGVTALQGARLDVRPGEVHGLVGENGAGKSTLINISTGLFRADEGEIRVDGEVVQFGNVHQAAEAGIMVVHQEADLFAQMSFAENMLLSRGLVRGPLGFVDWQGTNKAAAEMVAAMGEQFDVRAEAGGLPVARRTMAEIASAVSTQPKVLFLDEPTSSLTLKEIENLFSQIRRLRDSGVGLVYVSHRLEEVLELCDRVTVMRDGATIETREAAGLTMDAIVSAMVGRELEDIHAKRPVPIGDVRFEATGITAADGSFRDVSLQVRGGEIVGLYGFVGAGRSEFAQALFGLRRMAAGQVRVDGREAPARSPREAVRKGLAYLPEDRLVQAVFSGHALRANASVTVLPRLSRLGLIRGGLERDAASKAMAEMNVRASSMEQPIGTLSGGNQQKVIFGRWMATAPKLLILDEPTRGVDVGAKAEIHKLICDLAEKGTAILLISSELPEVMAMSDRVVTLSEGRVTGEFVPSRDGEEAIAAAAVPTAEPEAEERQEKKRNPLVRALAMRESGLLAFVVLIYLAMMALHPEQFASIENLFDILSTAAIPAIMAQGAMLIICTGGIDISVGSMLGLVAALTGSMVAAQAGFISHPLVCLFFAMAMGAGLSLINAGAALVARIHPIIVTLAGLSIYDGIRQWALGGKQIHSDDLPPAFNALADGAFLGVPKMCWYVLIVALISHLILRRRLVGRQILALGNSEKAAQLIGLSKVYLRLLVFGISGALVGLAATLQASYYDAVSADTGKGMELEAIAAAVIGGANILGGRGSAIGALLGAFLVSLIVTSLKVMQSNDYWQEVFVGGLILVAVIMDAGIQRLKRRQA